MPLILLTPKSLHRDCLTNLCGALRTLDYEFKSITRESASALHGEIDVVLSSYSSRPASRWILVRPALGSVDEWWLAGDARHWADIDKLIAEANGLIVEYELERSIGEQDEFVLRISDSEPSLTDRLLGQIKRVSSGLKKV